jgi:hypothetical protein
MTLLAASSGQKKQEPQFDPNPEVVHEMPLRPYTVLHDLLPFCSDAGCRVEVEGARLIVLRSDDPRQTHHPIEAMPTRKIYARGQTLAWEINPKVQWAESWYINPNTGSKEKAWARAVEFVGKVVKS